jgi:putative membrane protein
MEKVQSLRLRQGPVQRRLRLATAHLDTAGRGWQAAALCRDQRDADVLLARLTAVARQARSRARAVLAVR